MKKQILKILIPATLLIAALFVIGISCTPGSDCESQLWYADNDGDGYGNPDKMISSCDQPQNYVLDNTDCDDNNAEVHPNAREILANDIDDNCNGQIDEE